MKKTIISILLIIVSITAFGQTENAQNELKINMFNLIAFKWLDVGYERVLNEESTIGFGTLISLDHDSAGLDEYRRFSLTPYYRHFFSDKYAQGFFIEAFTMIHTGKNDFYSYDYNEMTTNSYEDTFTDLAVGVSVGAKWVTQRGFVAEIYAGIGRDMFNQSEIEVVGRGGMSIGYRFQ